MSARPAHDVFQTAIPLDDITVFVGQQNAVARLLDDTAELVLGVQHGLLGLLALGYVVEASDHRRLVSECHLPHGDHDPEAFARRFDHLHFGVLDAARTMNLQHHLTERALIDHEVERQLPDNSFTWNAEQLA